MVNKILLNNVSIDLKSYEENDGQSEIQIIFDVKSDEYHDIAVLLYHEVFDVEVPERNLKFRGKIVNYYTDRTNLYEAGQVGEYNVTLKDVKAAA